MRRKQQDEQEPLNLTSVKVPGFSVPVGQRELVAHTQTDYTEKTEDKNVWKHQPIHERHVHVE